MMKKSKNNQKIAPTQSEAVRAIYIDFEGFTDRLPSFMGLQIDENFHKLYLMIQNLLLMNAVFQSV